MYALYAAKFELRVAPEAFVLHLPGPHELAKGCETEPVFDVIRPLAQMPGHTCVDACANSRTT